VDFSIVPHLNSKKYPKTRARRLKEFLKGIKGDVYALDDDSGIICSNGKIQVVSEGRWIKY
jgi:dipeptidase E